MRRSLLSLVLLLGACAHNPPPVSSPASDPVRIADGFRIVRVPPLTTGVGSLPPETATVRLTANGVTSTQTVPANVPLTIEFDSVDPRWTGLPAADRWYLVKLDGVQQAHAGVLVETSAAHFRIPTNTYVFTPGAHSAEVSLVYPSTQVLECGPTEIGCDNSCTVGQDCYGQPTTVSVEATSAVLSGPPPSVSNGQVIR